MQCLILYFYLISIKPVEYLVLDKLFFNQI
nr:MAG TPA: hypothetical protein [Caudoviricetes sp.]